MTDPRITGRHARSELIEIADLVTGMTLLEHPHEARFQAQRGVEF